MTLYVRAVRDLGSILGEVQREVKGLAPQVEISDIRTGARIMDQILWGARIVVSTLGVFGFLALVLASVGPYGLLAYLVRGRQREIGVRLVLGASRPAILILILRQGMILVCAGIGIGLAISLLVGRVFAKMLFGLSPADPFSLLGASAALILVSALACYLPALNASKLDSMRALRQG